MPEEFQSIGNKRKVIDKLKVKRLLNIPEWTDSTRPINPEEGILGYNTERNAHETFRNGVWAVYTLEGVIGVYTPNITSPTNNETDVSNKPTLVTDAFSSDIVESHNATQFQISTIDFNDPSFDELTHVVYDSGDASP